MHFKTLLTCCLVVFSLSRYCRCYQTMTSEGSYAFQEAENRRPPQIKRPPYTQTRNLCPGANSEYYKTDRYQSLCGDLNDGHIPVNPMGQAPLGQQYPFDIIKKKALKFFAKTIPTLRKDDHVPKVAVFEDTKPPHREAGGADYFSQNYQRASRQKRQTDGSQLADSSKVLKDSILSGGFMQKLSAISKTKANVTKEQARQFLSALCNGQENFFCTIMSMIAKPAKIDKNYEEDDDDDDSDYFAQAHNKDDSFYEQDEGPGTPCPSFNEYVTPTFARNHHGIWRYVVQIPYEGYFTQTIQVTRCRNAKCSYLSGDCKSSPRWISLLVAEIYYPDLYFEKTTKQPPKPSPTSYHRDSHTSTHYPVYRPNEKPVPGNVGPFTRPENHKNNRWNSNSQTSQTGPYYRPTSISPEDQYQSLSGYGNKDSFLRTGDADLNLPADFNAYQQHLQELANAHKKEKKEVASLKIRTKRQLRSLEFDPVSLNPSILKTNLTKTDLPKHKNGISTPSGSSKNGELCDGYDNLGCFVVRMYYDWFVVSGECKCWRPHSRHVFHR